MKNQRLGNGGLWRFVVTAIVFVGSACFTEADQSSGPIKKSQFVGNWSGYVGDMRYHFLRVQISDGWRFRAVGVDESGRTVEYKVTSNVADAADGYVTLTLKAGNEEHFDSLKVKLIFQSQELMGYKLRETGSGYETGGMLYNESEFMKRIRAAQK